MNIMDIEITPLEQWIPKWHPKLCHPLIVAGPCSAESEGQVLETAHRLARQKFTRIFRLGLWKPRTRPGGFEGVGERGLPWAALAKRETGLMTAVEVANRHHVELALAHGIDVLWLGARTTAGPFAVQEIADALQEADANNVPVMVKNPIHRDLSLWIGAIERLYRAGSTKIVAVHRGFGHGGGGTSLYRNLPHWPLPLELKSLFPTLPILCDPSHIAGDRAFVPEICQQAMDVGMDGLMIETHPNPDQALSDARQQITPDHLDTLLRGLTVKREFSGEHSFDLELEKWREQIDRIDADIIEALRARMTIVERIGQAKRQNKVIPFQGHRHRELIQDRIALGKLSNLSTEYIRELFHIIHGESLKQQLDDLDRMKSRH